MMYKSLLAGSALLAAAGNAVASDRRSSSSTCSLKTVTTASSESNTAIALAIEEIETALCGDAVASSYHAKAASRVLATAYAEAIVNVDVACYASGNAEFKVNGQSSAYAQATALAVAFAQAEAKADSCPRCKSASKAIATTMKKIYVDATAKVELDLYETAAGADVDAVFELYNKAYESATVVAFTEAILAARASDEECSTYVKTIAGAGEKDGIPNVVSCELDIGAASDYVVYDALAVATAEAGAKACYGSVDSGKYTIEAQAVASAMALAVTEVSGSCYVQGKGYGCAMGKAEIVKTAKAVATAYAKGYAKATSQCFGSCKVEYSALTTAIAEVLATAYSDIYFNQCTDNSKSFDYDNTKSLLVKASAPAIAQVIAKAAAYAYNICEVVVDPKAYVGPTTTKKVPGGYLPEPTYTKPTYTKPTPTYTKPTYTKPTPTYTKPTYTKPTPTYTKPTPTYTKPTYTKPTYTKPTPTYTKPTKRTYRKKSVSLKKRPTKGWKKGGRKGGRKVSKSTKKITLRTKSKAGRTFFRGKAATFLRRRKN